MNRNEIVIGLQWKSAIRLGDIDSATLAGHSVSG